MSTVKQRRGYVRKRVTEAHNRSSSFANLSDAELHKTKFQIQNYMSELVSYNKEVQDSLADGTTQADIDAELGECESYADKIFHCLSLLERSPL